jgi:hypothetical protein
VDTLSFFQTILPDTGPYYLVIFAKGRPLPAHKSYASLEEMAAAAAEFDRNPALSVYYACASYNEPFVQLGDKRKYRIEPNWQRAKAFWCDIDCGEDKAAAGKGYLTKQEAAQAISGFCGTTGFPAPMIVDSGHGLHCYWPLTKAIIPEKWQLMAATLKSALQHFEIRADPSRTADFASILRPAGSSNKKLDGARVVTVKRVIEPLDPAEIARALASIVDTFHVKREQVVRQPVPGLNDDLTAHLQVEAPSSAIRVAERCQQIRFIRDTRGQVGYDLWRGGAGIIKHCIEGAELLHEWSRGHPQYSEYETQLRYDTWNTGPPTCEFLRLANPDGCDGCEHRGNIKTPIVLGRFQPEPQQLAVEAPPDVVLPTLPDGYQWQNNHLIRYVQDKDGVLQPHRFSDSLYYPVQRVRTEAGTYATMLRAHLPDGRVREFTLDTSNVAAPSDLMKTLAGKGEIFATNQKDSAMHHSAYLRDSLEKLKRESEEANTMLHFGWQDNGGFLIGDRLYKPDGSVQRVLLGGNVTSNKSHFPDPTGSVQKYAEAVNAVYRDSRMLPMQYVFSSAFGCLLTPFGEPTYHGLLMCLIGQQSGKGKTSVSKIALYGFGDAETMTIGARGYTPNGLPLRLAAYKNLPLLLDEMTNIGTTNLSDLAYNVAQGIDKSRAQMRGGVAVQHSLGSWHTSPILTANTDMYAVLASHRGNAEAEAARILQINIDNYDIIQFEDKTLVERALAQVASNSGVAGEHFVRYIVTNKSAIEREFMQLSGAMKSEIGIEKLRFYVNHAVTTLIAARINKELGIADFDVGALRTFAVDLIRQVSHTTTAMNTIGPEEAANRMIADLSPRIITTDGYRAKKDARGPEKLARSIQGKPAGRWLRGEHTPKGPDPLAGRLYIVAKEVHDWLVKERVNEEQFFSFLTQHGAMISRLEKFDITRGVEGWASGVAQTCIVIDTNRLSDTNEVSTTPHLHVVHGKQLDRDAEQAVS